MAGISGYGNSVGVPTIGGELTFEAGYARNPLVNVLCLGVMPKERLVLSGATARATWPCSWDRPRDATDRGRERAGLGRLRW